MALETGLCLSHQGKTTFACKSCGAALPVAGCQARGHAFMCCSTRFEIPLLLPWQEGEVLASLHRQQRQEPARDAGKEQCTDHCSSGEEFSLDAACGGFGAEKPLVHWKAETATATLAVALHSCQLTGCTTLPSSRSAWLLILQHTAAFYGAGVGAT